MINIYLSYKLLLIHSIWGIMLVINRTQINTNNEDDYYEALVERQEKADKSYDTLRNYNSISNRVY